MKTGHRRALPRGAGFPRKMFSDDNSRAPRETFKTTGKSYGDSNSGRASRERGGSSDDDGDRIFRSGDWRGGGSGSGRGGGGCRARGGARARGAEGVGRAVVRGARAGRPQRAAV